MGTTDKYGFDEIGYGATGWNGLLASNMQSLDNLLNTYLRYQVGSGESISEGDPICVQNNNWHKSYADGVNQPCNAVAIESGTSGEYLRGQRCGELEVDSWSLSGSGEIFLSVSGEITQTSPDSNVQSLGSSCRSNAVLLNI